MGGVGIQGGGRGIELGDEIRGEWWGTLGWFEWRSKCLGILTIRLVLSRLPSSPEEEEDDTSRRLFFVVKVWVGWSFLRSMLITSDWDCLCFFFSERPGLDEERLRFLTPEDGVILSWIWWEGVPSVDFKRCGVYRDDPARKKHRMRQ